MIPPTIHQTIHTHVTGGILTIVHGTVGGMGMAYAVQQGKLWQLPIPFLFPYFYGGYHIFKNKDTVIQSFVSLTKGSIPR